VGSTSGAEAFEVFAFWARLKVCFVAPLGKS
jgi:hypothetical protein